MSWNFPPPPPGQGPPGSGPSRHPPPPFSDILFDIANSFVPRNGPPRGPGAGPRGPPHPPPPYNNMPFGDILGTFLSTLAPDDPAGTRATGEGVDRAGPGPTHPPPNFGPGFGGRGGFGFGGPGGAWGPRGGGWGRGRGGRRGGDGGFGHGHGHGPRHRHRHGHDHEHAHENQEDSDWAEWDWDYWNDEDNNNRDNKDKDGSGSGSDDDESTTQGVKTPGTEADNTEKGGSPVSVTMRDGEFPDPPEETPSPGRGERHRHGHGRHRGRGRRGGSFGRGRGGRGGRGCFFGGFGHGHGHGHREGGEDDASKAFVPPMDLFRTADSWILHVAVPGAKKEDVNVNWDGDRSTLVISGLVYRPGGEEMINGLVSGERRVGLFEREVQLPPVQVGGADDHEGHSKEEQIDSDRISARMEDGVLIVVVPRVEKEVIEVKRVNIL